MEAELWEQSCGLSFLQTADVHELLINQAVLVVSLITKLEY
jgi:hypothetical protein